MVSTATFSALAIAVLAASTTVDAHGTLAKPGLKFTGSGYGGNFYALVPMNSLKPQAGDKWGTMNANNDAAAFGRAFKASQYKTFKDFILKNQDLSKGRTTMPKTPECGFTDPTGGAVQPLPNQLEWYGGQMNHPGPCEVWCDNEVVVPFTPNCAQTFPQGKISYNKAKCEGKSRLTLYWMSTLLEWQVYTNCAKIGGGRSRSLDFDDIDDTPAAGGMYNASAHSEEAEEEALGEAMKLSDLAEEKGLGDSETTDADRQAYEEANVPEVLPEPDETGNESDEEAAERRAYEEANEPEVLPEPYETGNETD